MVERFQQLIFPLEHFCQGERCPIMASQVDGAQRFAGKLSHYAGGGVGKISARGKGRKTVE